MAPPSNPARKIMPQSAVHTREVILAFFSRPAFAPPFGRRASKQDIKLWARHNWPGWTNPEPTMDQIESAVSSQLKRMTSGDSPTLIMHAARKPWEMYPTYTLAPLPNANPNGN